MKSEITEGSRPAWYELSLVGDGCIQLAVHRLALEEMTNAPWGTAPIIPEYKKKFGFKEFTPPGETSCGFDNVFQLEKSTRPDWVVYNIVLPRIKTPRNTSEYSLAVRATLSLFVSNRLWLFEGDTQWHEPQLMVIDGICLPLGDRSLGNGALGVILSHYIIKWIAAQPEGHSEPLVKALRGAYNWMWPSELQHGRFGAHCRRPKWLSLTVPGNACGLDPDNHYHESLDEGYTLVPHNVDSTIQQLTFLAGLAKLHELVRMSTSKP